MSATVQNTSPGNAGSPARGILARLLQIVIFMALIAAILFLAAGRTDWLWAWIYLAICVAVLVVNGLLMRGHAETVAERGTGFGQTRDWDRLVAALWALAQYIAIPLVAGLDGRFTWTQGLGVGWQVAGAVALVAGLALNSWAMISNAYFSTAVRIQSDRGQTVCRTGPYRFVRHPGYAGAVVQCLAVPLLLGSLWALIPGVLAVGVIAIRTTLEDRTLQAELAGYREFTQEVRYRLLPYVW